ncbi:hybrid sensor histidine kinase/response regulator transcription factor [Persicobacter diffluens]|uniref:histidine kinase n=1 Tax=Persicobacter diffluens TaxID=981 RepID=A0AAN5AQC8_9BACT|nr:hypothetical protein PEDI_52750 [Persicobacter diffluens]
MKHLFSCFLLLIVVTSTRITLAENINFETFTRKEGLSHSLITNTTQDKTGYMWFGTQDGLLRYDGYHFKVFKPNKEDPKSIQSSWISELLVDSRNQLWIRFKNGGISVYDPNTEDFYNFVHTAGDSSTISHVLSSYQIHTDQRSMQETPDGHLWVCTMNGLNRINIESKEVKRYYKETHGLNGNIITALFLEGENLLWIGTNAGLNLLDLKTETFRSLGGPLTNKQIVILTKDAMGTYWAGTKSNGLYRFELKEDYTFSSVKGILTGSDQIEHIRNQGVLSLLVAGNFDLYLGMHQGFFRLDQQGNVVENITKNYPMPTIGRLIQDDQGNIWAGGLEDHIGLFKYHPATGELIEYNESQLTSNGYSFNKITSIHQSEDQVLWIGTSKGGLMKCNLNRKPFEHFGPTHFPKSDHMIHSICRKGNKIYVGTQLSFYIFDQHFNLLKHYKRGDGPNAIPSSVVGVMGKPTAQDKLWVGFFEGKVSEFDLKTETFKHYHQHLPEDSTEFHSWSPRSILTVTNGDTYFASITGGIKVKKRGESFFRNLSDLVKNPEMLKSSNYALMESKEGHIWIGSVKEGIYIYNPTTATINAFHANQALSSLEIKEIYQARNGEIWIATRYGLNRFNPINKALQTYLVKDGLPSNILHGILEDDAGNIWVSTNYGISRLEVTTDKFTNYLQQDGLLSNEFNERAFFKDEQGIFYFGDRKGIVKFHPEEMAIDPSRPQVILSSLEIGGDKNTTEAPKFREQLLLQLKTQHEINLAYRTNSFSATLSTLDFRTPKKIKYKYRLSGLEKTWNYTAFGENEINYPFLSPGQYTLEIMAANTDGVWSNKLSKTKIQIAPPWYQSAWFKSLLFLLALGALSTFVIIYIHLINKSKKILAKTVEERTAELKAVNVELRSVNEELQAQQEVVVNQNKELQNRQHELSQQKLNIELMAEMGRKITSNVELNRVFGEIYSNISELVDIDEMMIGQVNEKTGQLALWGIHGNVQEMIKDQIDLRSESRLSAYVVRHNQAIISHDLRVDTEKFLKFPDRKYQDKTSSGVYLPLNFRGKKTLGVLVAISYKLNAFTQTDLSLLSNLASYASIAITNASAYEKLYDQSEKLKNLDKIKSDFYTNVSHEFRTPLTLIQGPVKELLKSTTITLADKKLIQIVGRNSKLLLNLVEQIMELSRIDGGAIKFKEAPHHLGKHFETIYDAFKHLALQKNIEIIFQSELDHVIAQYDLDVLNKIIYNLLNNSIKYTKDGGLILFNAQLKAEGLEVRISDNGAGIPEEKIDQIFNRYYRLSEHADATTGSGIGLSIVKQLIDKLGGNISVESKYKDQFEDHGTTFTINIPLTIIKKDPAEDSPKTYAINSQSSQNEILKIADKIIKPKIMIVEDNADLRYLLYQQLEQLYNIMEASNGQEALALIEKEQPHLILSDIMMPEMDGLTMCRKIKSNDKICHIPIILITAKDAERDKLEGLEAGASDYITKPFVAEELFLKVKNWLQQRNSMIEHSSNSIWGEGIHKLNDDNPQDQEFINKIKNLIEDNIENSAMDIEFFCENLGVSRSWLYSKMKSLLGVSMNEFVRQCRLNLAAKMLVRQKLSTAQVAYSVGFNDPKYFARCFKKEFGIGPKQYLASKLEVQA